MATMFCKTPMHISLAHTNLHQRPCTPPDSLTDYSYDRHNNAWPINYPPSPQEKDTIAIIGVGYVGLHLINSFAPQFPIIALDVLESRVQQLSKQLSCYPLLHLTTDPSELKNATHFLIAVPTDIRANGSVNASNLEAAMSVVEKYARPGSTVIVESSVAVGMTRETLGPIMRSRNLKGGMSPERVDPGRTFPPSRSIPKIVSGLDDITPGSLQSIVELYSSVFDTVVPVSKPEVAEMMKLYENCQRMVCIAYANEMADACTSHGIDPFEVSSVAATKPFGYSPINPGVGVGGSCIPVNPFYLFTNNEFPLLRHATERMNQRPKAIAMRIIHSLKDKNTSLRILVVGVGFKRGQGHIGHSPSVALIDALQDAGVEVQFVDPLVAQSALPHVRKLDEKTEWNKQYLEMFDRIVVAVDQDGVDLEMLRVLGNKVEKFCL